MNHKISKKKNINYKCKELTKHVKDLESLTQVGIALSSEFKIDRLLQMIADMSRQLTKAQASALLMIEKKDGKYSYKFAGLSGISKKDVKAEPKGTGIYRVIMNTKKPLCIQNLKKDPRSVGIPEGHVKITSFLGVPLITYRNKLKGMLLLSHNKPNKFGKYEQELVTIIASQAAVAIENAELNYTVQHSLKNLEKANDELQSLDQMKSDFLANISHELRTPLTSIKGYTHLFLEKKFGALTNDQIDKLYIILRNTERLIFLINNLLISTKLERTVLQFNITEFNPESLIKHRINEMTPLATSKGLKLVLQNNLNKHVKVLGDDEKINLVLINLIGNAIKFTDKGEIIIKIEKISGEDIKFINCPNRNDCYIDFKKKYIKISVIDKGIGIPIETIDKIFHRFYQADSSSTRKFDGTGIGLSIVKDVLNLHKVPIEVESTIGIGSIFSFVLPEVSNN